MKKQIFLSRVIRNALLIVTSFFLLIIPAACDKNDKDNNPEPGQAPTIPPESTFVSNFTDFTEGDTTTFKSAQTYHNWAFAATHVWVWNTLINVTFVVPVVSFRESFKHAPVYDPDEESWVWSYNFFAQNTVHLAELHGKVIDDSVKWEMYITKNNVYSDYLWYHGMSKIGNTGGHWHLNGPPEDPGEKIAIDWNRNPVASEADIKYTIVIEGDEGYGSYIHYGIYENELLNAYYTIYGAKDDNLVEIEWHRTNENGRVMNEMHFGDPNWHCWDENLMDVTCE
ncbi:MAG: hypothetical protein KDC05_04100 [Bacteroidales bacterium]|nr:hypothetical protein [Bacteroidales bacterium]